MAQGRDRAGRHRPRDRRDLCRHRRCLSAGAPGGSSCEPGQGRDRARLPHRRRPVDPGPAEHLDPGPRRRAGQRGVGLPGRDGHGAQRLDRRVAGSAARGRAAHPSHRGRGRRCAARVRRRRSVQLAIHARHVACCRREARACRCEGAALRAQASRRVRRAGRLPGRQVGAAGADHRVARLAQQRQRERGRPGARVRQAALEGRGPGRRRRSPGGGQGGLAVRPAPCQRRRQGHCEGDRGDRRACRYRRCRRVGRAHERGGAGAARRQRCAGADAPDPARARPAHGAGAACRFAALVGRRPEPRRPDDREHHEVAAPGRRDADVEIDRLDEARARVDEQDRRTRRRRPRRGSRMRR